MKKRLIIRIFSKNYEKLLTPQDFRLYVGIFLVTIVSLYVQTKELTCEIIFVKKCPEYFSIKEKKVLFTLPILLKKYINTY